VPRHNIKTPQDTLTDHLSLGMPKDRTIALLSERYEVSPRSGGQVPDSWAVSEKTSHPYVIGVLSFVNGMLIRTARFWDTDDSSYGLAQMSLLIDHLRDEGLTHCTISTRKIATKPVPPSLLPNPRSFAGTSRSAILPSPMASWTVWFTTPTASKCAESP